MPIPIDKNHSKILRARNWFIEKQSRKISACEQDRMENETRGCLYRNNDKGATTVATCATYRVDKRE